MSVASRPESSSSGSVRKRSGSRSSARVQPSRRLKSRLPTTMRRAVRRSSSSSTSQPVTGREQRGPLRPGLVEHPAQELAEDQRVHDRRAVLGLDGGGHVGVAAGQPVEVAGQVRLVGARAVVVGAAGVHGQAERHRVKRARLVAGQLEALHVRGEDLRALADRRGGAARALGEQVAEALAGADLGERAGERLARRRSAARARRSARARRTPSPRRACRPRRSCRCRGRRRASWRRARRRGRTRRRAGRARTRSRTPRARCRRRARRRCARSRSCTRRSCRAPRGAARGAPRRRACGAPSNEAALKLRVGSVLIALNERRLASVPSSRYLAVAGPKERPRRSRAAASTAGRVRERRLHARASDGHGLDVLRAQHGAEAAAAGVAAVVRHGRVAHEPLAGRADRGDAPCRPEPLAQARLGAAAGRPHRSPAGSMRAPSPSTSRTDGSVARAAHDDRVVAGELAGDREVATTRARRSGGR